MRAPSTRLSARERPAFRRREWRRRIVNAGFIETLFSGSDGSSITGSVPAFGRNCDGSPFTLQCKMAPSNDLGWKLPFASLPRKRASLSGKFPSPDRVGYQRTKIKAGRFRNPTGHIDFNPIVINDSRTQQNAGTDSTSFSLGWPPFWPGFLFDLARVAAHRGLCPNRRRR